MGAGQTRPSVPGTLQHAVLATEVFGHVSSVRSISCQHFVRKEDCVFLYWSTRICLEKAVAQLYTGKAVWLSKGRLCSCQGLETVPGPKEMIALIGSRFCDPRGAQWSAVVLFWRHQRWSFTCYAGVSIFIQCQHAGVNAFLLTSECYKRTCPQTHYVTYKF